MIDSRFAMIRQGAQQMSRQQRTDGLPPVWSDPDFGPNGRYSIRHASTRQKTAPQQLAAPAAAPTPAAASPQQLVAMRAAFRQAVLEDLALNAKPAPPAPPAKGGFASRIRVVGGFSALKKRAAAAVD